MKYILLVFVKKNNRPVYIFINYWIMGNKGNLTKQKIIEATADALEENGFLATGLNEIISLADVPKGSLYFHFPGGKDELASLALEHSGKEFAKMFEHILLNSKSPTEATIKIFQNLENRVVASNFKKGCPIVISALESFNSESVVQHVCKEIYNSWIQGFIEFFVSYGYSRKSAKELSTSLFSLWEGALLLAKLQKSIVPLRTVSKIAINLLSSYPKT